MNKLFPVLAQALNIPLEDVADDSGMGLTENWDSLAQFNIVAAVESEFRCKIPFDDISKLDTAAKLRAFLSGSGVDVGG